MRNGLPCCSLAMVSVSETLPRFRRLPTAVRAGFSRRSKPCGTRQRISRLRPLTLRASQTQRRRSSDPCARAYPVMLAIKNRLHCHSTGRTAARHSSIGPERIQRAPPEGYPMKRLLKHRHHRRLERHRRGAGARLCRAGRGARADRPRRRPPRGRRRGLSRQGRHGRRRHGRRRRPRALRRLAHRLRRCPSGRSADRQCRHLDRQGQFLARRFLGRSARRSTSMSAACSTPSSRCCARLIARKQRPDRRRRPRWRASSACPTRRPTTPARPPSASGARASATC